MWVWGCRAVLGCLHSIGALECDLLLILCILPVNSLMCVGLANCSWSSRVRCHNHKYHFMLLCCQVCRSGSQWTDSWCSWQPYWRQSRQQHGPRQVLQGTGVFSTSLPAHMHMSNRYFRLRAIALITLNAMLFIMMLPCHLAML